MDGLAAHSQRGSGSNESVPLPRASLSKPEDDEEAAEYYAGSSSDEEEEWLDAEDEEHSSAYNSDAGGWDDERADQGSLVARQAAGTGSGGKEEEERGSGQVLSVEEDLPKRGHEEGEHKDGGTKNNYPALSVSKKDENVAGELNYFVVGDNHKPEAQVSLGMGGMEGRIKEEHDVHGEDDDGGVKKKDELVKEDEEHGNEYRRREAQTARSLSRTLLVRAAETVQGIDFEEVKVEELSDFKQMPVKTLEHSSASLRIRSSETVQGVRFEDEEEEDPEEQLTRGQVTPGWERGKGEEKSLEEGKSPSPYGAGIRVRQQSAGSPQVGSHSPSPDYSKEEPASQSGVQAVAPSVSMPAEREVGLLQAQAAMGQPNETVCSPAWLILESLPRPAADSCADRIMDPPAHIDIERPQPHILTEGETAATALDGMSSVADDVALGREHQKETSDTLGTSTSSQRELAVNETEHGGGEDMYNEERLVTPGCFGVCSCVMDTWKRIGLRPNAGGYC